jgi:ABC-type lipoprotein export system ATPase subunit
MRDGPTPEPPLAGMAVRTRRLSKTFKAGDSALHVLKNVDLDIRRGEFVSVMGPSGSGKSTLLHLVGLLDVPTEGEVHLLGTETGRMSGRQRALMRRRTLGFVFQSFNLMPRLNALYNVMLPMAIAGVPRRERRERAQRLLHEVGLGDRMGHRPAQLSGGQKQRVAIARALALDPPILLADEPTGNLDSRTGAEIMRRFQELNRAGKTIVQVTHDPDMAAFGTRIVRLLDGVLVGEPRAAAPPSGGAPALRPPVAIPRLPTPGVRA